MPYRPLAERRREVDGAVQLRCSFCNRWKPEDAFYPRPGARITGRHSRCGNCCRVLLKIRAENELFARMKRRAAA